MAEIKDRIKKLRLEKKLNQPELARIMNVSKQTISNWENGNRIPDTLTIKKLADFFNVSTDYILGKDNQLSSLSNTVIEEIKLNVNNERNKFINHLSKQIAKDLEKANINTDNMSIDEQKELSKKVIEILKILKSK